MHECLRDKGGVLSESCVYFFFGVDVDVNGLLRLLAAATAVADEVEARATYEGAQEVPGDVHGWVVGTLGVQSV